MVLVALAVAHPAHALLTLSVSDAGGPISACSATDGGTGTVTKTCSNPNFASISVTAVGHPLTPSPNLITTTLNVTSGALAAAQTLAIDVAQTGLSFPGGSLFVNLTVAGNTGPMTLTALGPGGAVLLSQVFTASGDAQSAAIPVGPVTDDGARYTLAFSGPFQTANALISITGVQLQRN
jgi:hypothetical protein